MDDEDEVRVKRLTALMRASDDPLWERLRVCLRNRAVPPETSYVADFFPDDHRQYFGLLITGDQKVIRFDLSFENSVEDAIFSTWADLTSEWISSPYDGQIAAALAVKRSGRLEPPPVQQWLDEDATSRLEQVKNWFGAKGLDLQLRIEGGAHLVDVILRATGKVIGHSYAKGSSAATAAEAARKQYRQEQLG